MKFVTIFVLHMLFAQEEYQGRHPAEHIRSTWPTMIRKLSTFAQQSTIQRLPIPSLQQSTTKYLAALQPLLSPEKLKIESEKIARFNDGLGKELQDRLIAYDNLQPVRPLPLQQTLT
jgi:hypothetical protein